LKKVKVDSRKIGLFLEEVRNELGSERRDMIRYLDKVNDELNKSNKYSEYLAEKLDDALTRISNLENQE